MKKKKTYERPNPVLSSQFPAKTAETVEAIQRVTGKKRTEILKEVVHAGLPIFIENNGLSDKVQFDEAA